MKKKAVENKNQKADNLKKVIRELRRDVPEDILKKVDEQLELQASQERISPLVLTKELFSVAPELKKKLRISQFFACIGEIFAFACYFFGAYAASWLLKYNTNKVINFDNLIKYAIYAFLALMIYLILTGISTIISHKVSFTILSKLRIHLFKKLQEIPLGYMVENPIGKIKVLIHDRVGDLEDWVAHLMPELPSRILHPILCTTILFILDWRIGLAIFAPLPFMIVGMAAMMNKYEARMMTWMTSYSNVADRSTEYVRGIPVIKAFLQGDNSYKHFAEAVNFYHDSTMDWWKKSWFGMAMSISAIMTPLLASLPVAIYLYNTGDISISTLLLAIILPLSILPQAFPIIQSFELYQNASNTWILIRELLFMKKQERPNENKEITLDKEKGIEFKNVSFSYKKGKTALKEVNFKAEKNQMTAIVGPSGSGKSTIAKLISGYWDIEQGEILIEGVNTKDMSFNQLMAEISYVSQDNYLFDTSIKDNIKIGKPEASDEELINAAKSANCHNFIMELPNGYDTKVGDAGNLLSGGEKQRIALARCILKPASIIVLDEATAYTDPENEASIQEAISKLIKDKTLIIIAHRLHTIKNAGKILLMDKGKIVDSGTHQQLIKSSELYKRLNQKYDEEVA